MVTRWPPFDAHRLVVRGGSFGGFEEHGSGPLAVHMVSSRTAPARAVPPTASELVAVMTWPAGTETGRVATNVIEEERESDVRGRRRCCGHRCRVNASFNTSTTGPSECNSLTSTLNDSGTGWKIVLMLDDRLVGLFCDMALYGVHTQVRLDGDLLIRVAGSDVAQHP